MQTTVFNPKSKEFRALKKAADFSGCFCRPSCDWWASAWAAAKAQGFDGLLGKSSNSNKVLFQRRGCADEVLVVEF